MGKQEVKLTLFILAVYVESPIDSTKKQVDLVSKFDKRVGYKVNIQKLKAFLYTHNEKSEREIMKNFPLP